MTSSWNRGAPTQPTYYYRLGNQIYYTQQTIMHSLSQVKTAHIIRKDFFSESKKKIYSGVYYLAPEKTLYNTIYSAAFNFGAKKNDRMNESEVFFFLILDSVSCP